MVILPISRHSLEALGMATATAASIRVQVPSVGEDHSESDPDREQYQNCHNDLKFHGVRLPSQCKHSRIAPGHRQQKYFVNILQKIA